MINFVDLFDILKKQDVKTELALMPSSRTLINKLQSGQYNLVIDQARYPLNSLSSIFESYDLYPEYQRNKIWDISRKSKLIESLIINVPIPPIFLYEVDYNSFEVMDGLQRISTIIDFFDDKFKLKDLEIWPELNGLTFSELLPEFQSSIKRRYLSASIILKESNVDIEKENDLKKIVFERLNTGGIKLSQQEIRNALDSGEINRMINDLGDNNQEFLSTWHYPKTIIQIQNDINRMENREMILRFFAYKDSIVNNIKKGTKSTLDLYSSSASKYGKDKAEKLKIYFIKTLQLSSTLFGSQAFNKKEGSASEKMVFDTVMLACSRFVDEGTDQTILNNKDSINIENNNKLKNSFFEDNSELFNGKYTSLSKVEERYETFYYFIKDILG